MNSRYSSYFFFILLLGLVLGAVLLILPFLTPLVLAVAGAVIVYPLYLKLLSITGKSSLGRTLAALISVFIVIIVILVPLFFLTGSIYSEVQSLYSVLTDESSRSEVIDTLNNASQTLSNMVFGVLPAQSFDSFNATLYLKTALEWVFTNLDMVFSSLLKIGIYALLFLIALFYFLRDGHSIKDRLISWSPLLEKNDEYITKSFKRAIRSVFVGTIAVSVIEGISTGLAFAVFGIPAPALWGTVAAVASIIPGFGVSLLILPGVAYLFLSGNILFAIGLLIWGYAVIIFVDHILGPNLVNKGVNMHPFLILVSVLGGIAIFGLVGFVMGPIILVSLFTLLDIYKNSQWPL